MRDPLADIAASLRTLAEIAPPPVGAYDVKSIGGGLYRLDVCEGARVIASPITARPQRLARVLRVMLARA